MLVHIALEFTGTQHRSDGTRDQSGVLVHLVTKGTHRDRWLPFDQMAAPEDDRAQLMCATAVDYGDDGPPTLDAGLGRIEHGQVDNAPARRASTVPCGVQVDIEAMAFQSGGDGEVAEP